MYQPNARGDDMMDPNLMYRLEQRDANSNGWVLVKAHHLKKEAMRQFSSACYRTRGTYRVVKLCRDVLCEKVWKPRGEL